MQSIGERQNIVGLGVQWVPSTSRVQLREALYRSPSNVVDVGDDLGNHPLRLMLFGFWFPDGLGAKKSDLPTLCEKLMLIRETGRGECRGKTRHRQPPHETTKPRTANAYPNHQKLMIHKFRMLKVARDNIIKRRSNRAGAKTRYKKSGTIYVIHRKRSSAPRENIKCKNNIDIAT